MKTNVASTRSARSADASDVRTRRRSSGIMSDDSITVQPACMVRGSVRVPGDKSISHRAAMLAALATGASSIHGFLTSEDCLHTLAAMEALGARVTRDGTRLEVVGTGGLLAAPEGVLDLGNSGTGMRLLAGLLAGQPFTAELTGDASLRSRPMGRIREPLERMGARVELLGERGCAPMRITGGGLRGIDYALPVASAQVKSCVLLAGLFAEGETRVREPKPTRDHTERLLKAMGADITVDGLTVTLQGGSGACGVLECGKRAVPGDFSSAAFWLVAAALREGDSVTVERVGLNPRRTALLSVLERMGAVVQVSPETPDGEGGSEWEPVGTVTVEGRALAATEIGGAEIPNLIDELPLVAVAAAVAEGRTIIRDAAELRVKESDRIAAMAAILSAFGVPVEETPDGMIIEGVRSIRGGASVDSRGDHRMAMAATVLALVADRPTRIDGTACIATSYPTFWEDQQRLTSRG